MHQNLPWTIIIQIFAILNELISLATSNRQKHTLSFTNIDNIYDQVERLYLTLVQMIATDVHNHYDSWDRYLQHFVYALHT